MKVYYFPQDELPSAVDDAAGTITLFVGKSLPLAYEPTVGRYDPITGDLIMDIGEHRLSRGTGFKFFRDALSLTCSMDNHETVHTLSLIHI